MVPTLPISMRKFLELFQLLPTRALSRSCATAGAAVGSCGCGSETVARQSEHDAVVRTAEPGVDAGSV